MDASGAYSGDALRRIVVNIERVPVNIVGDALPGVEHAAYRQPVAADLAAWRGGKRRDRWPRQQARCGATGPRAKLRQLQRVVVLPHRGKQEAAIPSLCGLGRRQ